MSAAPESAKLEWRSGTIGCIGLIMLFAAFWMAGLAIAPEKLMPKDTDGRGGSLLELAALFTSGGFGWGFAVLAVVAAYCAFCYAWCIFAPNAASALREGLSLHGPFGTVTPWADVRGLRVDPSSRTTAVEIMFAKSRPAQFNPIPRVRHRITGISADRGEAAAFVAVSEQMRLAAMRKQ